MRSVLHGMRSVVPGEAESGTKVSSLHLVSDVLQNGGVNLLLKLLAGVAGAGLGSVLSKESLGSGSLCCGLVSEGIVADGIKLHTGEVDLAAGAHGVDLVHSSDWDTVDLVGSGNGNQARLELLKSDDSLASESAGKKDENSAGFNTTSEFGGSWRVSSGMFGFIVGGVPLEVRFSWFIFSLLLDHLHRTMHVKD